MKSQRKTPLFAAGLLLAATCSWPAAGQAPRPTVTIFEGARLIVGDGSAIEDAAFIVENGRFTAVGRKGEVSVPAGAARIDLSGKTVMPAIVDAHGHPGFLDAVTGQLSKANFTRENFVDHLERYAYHGIAATISTGTDMGELAYKLRAETIPNAALIRTVGLGLAYPGSGPTDSSRNDVPYAVTSVAEARKAVQDLAPHKPDFVKIWVDSRNGRQQKLTPEMFTAAADEAHKQGLPSIAHVFDLADAKLLVRAGVEGFLHSIRDQEVDDEFIKLAKEHDIWITPNLGGINRASLIRENGTPAWFDEPLVRETIAPALIRERAQMYEKRKLAGAAAPAGVRRHQRPQAPCRRRAAGARQRRRRRRQPLARAADAARVRQHGRGRLHPDGDDRRGDAGFRESAAARPTRHGGCGQERRFHRARRQPARRHRQCPQDQRGLPERRCGRPRRPAGEVASTVAREGADVGATSAATPTRPRPEERALARVSKDGRGLLPCLHPSRCRATHVSSG